MKKYYSLLFVLFITASIGKCQEVDQKGASYLNELQLIKAKAHYQSILIKSPDNASALIGLGETYLVINSPDSARILFKKVLSSDIKNSFALTGMGKAALLSHDRQGETDYFDRARRADKIYPGLYCQVAEGCLRLAVKDTVTALVYLNYGLAINAKYAELHRVMGDLETLKKNYGAAANAYDRAIFFDPKSALAYRNLGFIHLLSHSWREAFFALDKSVAIDPDQILVYKYLGDLYYATGKYADAEKSYKIYLDRSEFTNDDQERFAVVLFFNKKYKESAELLEKLQEQSKDESVLLRIRGYIAFETGDFQNGVEYMKKFFALHHPDKIIASDYNYYARLLQKTGNDSGAIENYKKSIAMDASKLEIIEEIAKLSAKNKLHKEAAAYYNQMMANGADRLTTSFIVGKEYYFEGESWRFRFDSLKRVQKITGIVFSDSSAVKKSMKYYYDSADSTFMVVSRLNPDYPGSYLWIGRIQSILDQEAATTKAKEAYEKALALLEKSGPSKSKKSIIECYRYLGSYYYLGYERFFKTDKKQSAGMRTKCIDSFEKIIQLEPSDDQAREVLARMKRM
jgi:tetratricopeptide (TPR) repeat protein